MEAKESAIDKKIEEAIMDYYVKQNPEIADEIKRRKAPRKYKYLYSFLFFSIIVVLIALFVVNRKEGENGGIEKPTEEETGSEAQTSPESAEFHSSEGVAAFQENMLLYEDLKNLEDLLTLDEIEAKKIFN